MQFHPTSDHSSAMLRGNAGKFESEFPKAFKRSQSLGRAARGLNVRVGKSLPGEKLRHVTSELRRVRVFCPI